MSNVDGKPRPWIVFAVTVALLVASIATIVTYVKNAAGQDDSVEALAQTVAQLEGRQRGAESKLEAHDTRIRANANRKPEPRSATPGVEPREFEKLRRRVDGLGGRMLTVSEHDTRLASLEAKVAKLGTRRPPAPTAAPTLPTDLVRRADLESLQGRIGEVETALSALERVEAPKVPGADVLAALPVGTILPYGKLKRESAGAASTRLRAKLPDGWFLCDGKNGTPNLASRFLMGAGGGDALGKEGGTNAIPSEKGIHQHHVLAKDTKVRPGSAPKHWVYAGGPNAAQKSHLQFFFLRDAGKGHNHKGENRPQFVAVHYIMKVR